MMIVFGLKNLASDDWRDRIEHTGADRGPISWETVLLRAEEKRHVKTIEHEPTETSSADDKEKSDR
jgi:hypothetical protein